MTDKKTAVVAIGGNSLIKDKSRVTVQDQYEAAKEFEVIAAVNSYTDAEGNGIAETVNPIGQSLNSSFADAIYALKASCGMPELGEEDPDLPDYEIIVSIRQPR